MSKKTHIGWHDIDLYLREKTEKRELSEKKDHLVNELIEMKNELADYRSDPKIYEIELELYKERVFKNREVLEGLKMIFPEDRNLVIIVKDLM